MQSFCARVDVVRRVKGGTELVSRMLVGVNAAVRAVGLVLLFHVDPFSFSRRQRKTANGNESNIPQPQCSTSSSQGVSVLGLHSLVFLYTIYANVDYFLCACVRVSQCS